MSCGIAILIGIYLLIFHPFEWFLLFWGLWFMGNITLDTLRGYKRVEPAHKPAFRRAMRKHFLLCFTISAIPLVFIMAYLVSFILQQDPHHPFIGYMSIGVGVIFFFSYEHFIAPRIPPKAITATPNVLEILRKLPDKDQIQIEKTPDGRYLRRTKQKELLPLSRRALLIYAIILITLDVFTYFLPHWDFILVLITFLTGYIIERVFVTYKRGKPLIPPLTKAVIISLPFVFGALIEALRSGLTLSEGIFIALCIPTVYTILIYLYQRDQNPGLSANQSLGENSS